MVSLKQIYPPALYNKNITLLKVYSQLKIKGAVCLCGKGKGVIMIFYFSGTGNSRWVALKLAEKLGEKAVDITEVKYPADLLNEKLVGFVFPIYAWAPAGPMVRFAQKLPESKAFSFAVCTCGDQAGKAMKEFDKVYHTDSAYSIAMPSNYIVGTDLEPEAEMAKKAEEAAGRIQKIAREVLAGKKAYDVAEGPMAAFKTAVISKGFANFATSTKPFYADDRCDGCGLCARQCPRKVIAIKNSKPVWNGRCYQCMRCINACPQQAIQYGKITKNRKRYKAEKYFK